MSMNIYKACWKRTDNAELEYGIAVTNTNGNIICVVAENYLSSKDIPDDIYIIEIGQILL